MLIPVAHAGHWALYLLPVAVVLVAVIGSAIRERRSGGPPGGGPDEPQGP